MTTNNDTTDTMILDDKQLLEYIENDIIPCASCGEEIHVEESHRWVNRLVCEECVNEFENMDPGDEDNYDSVYEEENDS